MSKVHVGNVYPPDEYLLARCAPAGYGLGGDTKQYITFDQIDTTYTNGLYWVTCPGKMVEGYAFNYALLRVTGMGTIHCIQELFPFGLDMVLIRRCYEGVWPSQWGKNTWESSVFVEG